MIRPMKVVCRLLKLWTRVISYSTLKRENSIFHAAVSTDVEGGGGGDGGGWFTHVCFEQVRLLQPYTILVSAIDARPRLDEY